MAIPIDPMIRMLPDEVQRRLGRLMRVWIDCEWSTYRGDLISMGLAAETGQTFYAELIFDPLACCQWVLDNVVPHLDGTRKVNDLQLSHELQFFLRGLLAPTIEIIADWPEDIERFCRALIIGPGKRIATPDLTFRIINADGAKSEVPHHALHDARALRSHHMSLMEQALLV
jgi:hypothetical protein